ncbi:hypothetical protein [Novosphingobium rosa]|uniref:hypothetical protein n=1 Tax=Novosphingobium rosa TaxID=76978 RepID=UPI0008303820|nr:hypothetical protein [Novosphingobium rosa]
MSENTPQWTQEQAIAYEAALEAINDVIAGYSEATDSAGRALPPSDRRLSFLRMRVSQARDVGDALDPADDASVGDVLREFSAMVRAREAVKGA